MATTDARIDRYIAGAAEFARPILTEIRKRVHRACPDVEETVKWGFPHFMYGGKILCSMAAFKEHCAFGFRHGQVVDDKARDTKAAMGQLGRITKKTDLPKAREFAGMVEQAMQLTESGAKKPLRPRRPAPAVPRDFLAALRRNRKALAAFEGFSPSHRREYIEWITEAKRADTRERRLKTAVEWLAAGKTRNWKYAGSAG